MAKCHVAEKGVEHVGSKDTMALSQAVAEVEWLHVMVRDMTDGDVTKADWSWSLTRFVALRDCRLAEMASQIHLGTRSPCMTC